MHSVLILCETLWGPVLTFPGDGSLHLQGSSLDTVFSEHCFCTGVQLLHSSCPSVATSVYQLFFIQGAPCVNGKPQDILLVECLCFVKIGSRWENKQFCQPRALSPTYRRRLQVVIQEWMVKEVPHGV